MDNKDIENLIDEVIDSIDKIWCAINEINERIDHME